MFQLAPRTGLVETVGLPPKNASGISNHMYLGHINQSYKYCINNKFSTYYVENLLFIQYLYDWFMCPKYMWLDMPDAFCCRLSLFRVFAKIKKTVSTIPGLPYVLS